MNAPEKIALLPDIQSQVDNRDLRIDAVGINGVRYPMTIRADKRLLPTIATLSMTVALPAVTKGTHMSRFIELLEAAREAGASMAGYVLLRLPYEVKDLFKAWLEEHYPLKASHVMSRVRAMRGGKEYDSEFGSRMRGEGEFADLLEKRFKVACRRLGFNRNRESLDTARFRPPQRGGQLALF